MEKITMKRRCIVPIWNGDVLFVMLVFPGSNRHEFMGIWRRTPDLVSDNYILHWDIKKKHKTWLQGLWNKLFPYISDSGAIETLLDTGSKLPGKKIQPMFKNPHRPERKGSYTPSETTVGTCEWGIFIIPTTTRRFKPWPFYPRIVEGRDSPFERVTLSPSQKGVTSRIARKGFFSKTSKGDSTCSNIIPPGFTNIPNWPAFQKRQDGFPPIDFFLKEMSIKTP